MARLRVLACLVLLSGAASADPTASLLKLETPPNTPRRICDAIRGAQSRVSRLSAQSRPQEVGQGLREVVAPLVSDTDMPAGDHNRLANQVAGILVEVGQKAPDPAAREATLRDALNLTADVVRRDPDNRDALINSSDANYGLKRYEAAAEAATNALRVDPSSERAYTIRALSEFELKNFPAAAEDAKRALALDPNNQVAFDLLQLAKNRVTTAEQLGLDTAQKAEAEKISREYGTQEDQRSQVESSPVESDRTDSARMPSAATDLVQEARQEIQLGNTSKAMDKLDRALAQEPNNPETLYLRAAAENMTGRYQDAVRDLSFLLKLKPNHVQALDARASALLQLRRYPEAYQDATRSILLNPRGGYAYKNRALTKEQMGDLAGMLADYRQAALLNPMFESECRAIAARYHLPLEPVSVAQDPVPETPPPARFPGRVLAVLLSSLSGGILIAAGLLHILAPRRPRLQTDQSLQASYEILRKVGNGGMGVVYEAMDRALGRKVAIKKLKDERKLSTDERKRFQREARIVAALHHPNILDIHTILEDGEDIFLVFEFIEGKTLQELLERKKRLSLAEARYITRAVLSALDFAHKRGVVHRDLKPANIMVASDGLVKVMDFGIARQAKDAAQPLTATETAAGTPLYMSPEQEMGIVRRESDLYSLGACLYEMVTGERAFPTIRAKAERSYLEPSLIVPGLPQELDALIAVALEPDPDRRIHSAAEFRARLDGMPDAAKVGA